MESRWRRAALAPLAPLSWAWASGARLHRAVYARGLRRPARPAGGVVVVGNLVAGGTGKTPVAAWLAAALRRRGHRAALLSRGHRGRAGEPVHVVSDGRFVLSRTERAGDEALVLAAHAPGVPVLVARDRALAGLRARSAFDADVLVLDDGFQHHRVARDVDVVTVDGSFGFGNRRVLPRGPLREGLAALRFADAFAIVDGPLHPDDAALLDRIAPDAQRFGARRIPSGLRPLRGGPAEPPRALAGEKVGILCGIARPEAFRATVARQGAEVTAVRAFPDHHRYRARDLRGLVGEASLWVTTEKDAGKLLPHWAGRADVRVLSVEIAMEDADGVLDFVESRMREPAPVR